MPRRIFPLVAILTVAYVGSLPLLTYVTQRFVSDPFYANFVPCYICTMGYMFFLPRLAWASGYQMARREKLLNQHTLAIDMKVPENRSSGNTRVDASQPMEVKVEGKDEHQSKTPTKIDEKILAGASVNVVRTFISMLAIAIWTSFR